jgi:hypothetical protein
MRRTDDVDDDETMASLLASRDTFKLEDCSVEVWRWGASIRLAIRSRQSVGKCIELSLEDAQDLAERLLSTMNADRRRIRDEPQA